LTNEQLFFAAYGQVWCSVMKEEIAVMRLSTDVHSPGKARVDVPLAQTEEFGKAFNCPLNSAMNPQEKCTVW
jgi:predicted metalloendopeptidase